MNPLAHLHIDFAAEPTGPGRFARRVAVALAALAALGIAAVIWLSAENRRAQEQLAALLAARPAAGAAAPAPPQDPRLDALRQRLQYDWSPEFQWLDRMASADGIRINAWNVTAAGDVRTVLLDADSAEHLTRLLGDLNGTGTERTVYWYAAQIGPGVGGAGTKLKARINGVNVKRDGR